MQLYMASLIVFFSLTTTFIFLFYLIPLFAGVGRRKSLILKLTYISLSDEMYSCDHVYLSNYQAVTF